MSLFLLIHRHPPDHCSSAWAAWNGHESPLRGETVACTCLHGGHAAWWEVEAASREEALTLLPEYVARTTVAVPMRREFTP
jgi:hypothetical protein